MVFLRQYIMYSLDSRQDGGYQPVEQLKEQSAVTKVECGLWAKNGSYVGFVEVNPGPDIDNVVSAINPKHGLKKLSDAQAISLIEEWWVGNLSPQNTTDKRIGSWLPAEVSGGLIVKKAEYY